MSRNSLRFEVRVKPGASGTSVGGTWGDRRALNVSVPERAIDGTANAAVIALLATVLEVRKRQLSIASGQTYRTKLIELTDPPTDAAERVERLRNRN